MTVAVRPALHRAARAEWGALYAAVRGGPPRKRPVLLRALPLTLGAVALTALLQLVQNQPWGYGPVQDLGAVQASLPWWLALLRTPLSLFVPALDLPVWGALAQILVVFGLCEICLGRLRTLAIAYLATLTGSLYARYGTSAGPGGFLGLPAEDAFVHDTGPSAAVVALAVHLSWTHRAWFTGGAVVLAMVVEVIVKPNLAGKEHLAALGGVLALWAVRSLWRAARVRSARRRWAGRPGAPAAGRLTGHRFTGWGRRPPGPTAAVADGSSACRADTPAAVISPGPAAGCGSSASPRTSRAGRGVRRR